MRTSTRVSGAPGGITEKRNRAPARTPAGTRSSTSWNARTSPHPPQQARTIPATSRHARRSADRSGAPGCPREWSSLEGFERSQDDLGRELLEAFAPKNAWRMRSRTSDTEGKSIATSSANHSSRGLPRARTRTLGVVTTGAAADRPGSRRRGQPPGRPPRGRLPRCPDDTGVPAAGTRA